MKAADREIRMHQESKANKIDLEKKGGPSSANDDTRRLIVVDVTVTTL
jgi:hypothetical protein